MFLVVSLLMAAVLQQPPAASPPARRPATTPTTPAATTPRPAAAGSATLNVRVTDRTGNPALEAMVTAEGPSSRSGSTDVLGTVVLRTLAPGTYRIRAERMGFIALEKEVVVRAGAPMTTEFALTAAPPIVEPPKPEPPPPAPAAPPPPAPVASNLTPGDPKTLSISSLAEKSLDGRDPVKTVPIGCSGASKSQLLVVREALNTPSRADVDDMVYLVAGEASLSMNGKDQGLTPSWFTLVPRGTAYTITRRGRNPAVLLTISSGQPCK